MLLSGRFSVLAAYDVWGNANLIVSGLVVAPTAIGANAARAAGTNVTRAAVTEIGKTTLSAGVGTVSGKAGIYFGTKRWGENIGLYVGLGTGILGGVASYGWLRAVDAKFNISGTHYNGFVNAMSPENAARYEEFLKNGSQEGLTEAEVHGIAKVYEHQDLKDINKETSFGFNFIVYPHATYTMRDQNSNKIYTGGHISHH